MTMITTATIPPIRTNPPMSPRSVGSGVVVVVLVVGSPVVGPVVVVVGSSAS
jgi:hypothetical protein